MLELENAVQSILTALPPPQTERVALAAAHRRFLGGDLAAPMDLPPFDNSSMDGYAVRAADVASAGAQTPVRLNIIGKAAAGEHFPGVLGPGQCVRVFTGSALPRGADAVVMQEEARRETENAAEILILDRVAAWENVRFQGEDVKRGAQLARGGEALEAARLGLLAASGISEVRVGCRPAVAVLATGSELTEAAHPLKPGRIYESNRAMLVPLIEEAGGLPKPFPIVPDELDATAAALKRALAESDLLVTCGGVSVGEMDFIKSTIERLGGTLQFWKVAIKPGRPFVFGRLDGKFLFGLPGNPVSALVTFLLLVRPAILRWQGARNTALPRQRSVLAEPLENPGSRRHFMRVAVDPAGEVRSAGVQASHVLSSMAAANGLVDMPPQTTRPAGAMVEVLRF